jgi:hypothetical protein
VSRDLSSWYMSINLPKIRVILGLLQERREVGRLVR